MKWGFVGGREWYRSWRHVVGVTVIAASVVVGVVWVTSGTSEDVASLPSPRPAAVRASGVVSMFPAPGTVAASPKTGITFGGVASAELGDVSVVGSSSGVHTGAMRVSSDGQHTAFVPAQPFVAGERVTVKAALAIRGASGGTASFTVGHTATPAVSAPATPTPPKLTGDELQGFVSRPDLHPPKLDVVTAAKNTAPGYIFLTPNGSDVQKGPLIVDNDGNVEWSDPVSSGSALDFSVQRYQGQPVLTWFQGKSAGGVGDGTYVIMDQSYHQIAGVGAGNGYTGDLHDFQITPQDTALFTAYSPVVIDATSVGGPKNQVVYDSIVEEVDIPTGVVVFEWHSLGTIALGESYQPLPQHPGDVYDYVHHNSVGLDNDGNVIMSGRHTSAVYKIDRLTATLDWRLGGKLSNFHMDDGVSTAWQHDARIHPDDTLTVFDNGAGTDVTTHKSSRGIVVRLDEDARTATLVHEYPAPKPISATSQGDMQLLANGDYLIGWGSQPEYTEYDADGHVLYDVKLPILSPTVNLNSYRAFRFTWHGTPTDSPAIVARLAGANTTIAVSWNGATDVTTWETLTGTSPDTLTPVTTASRNGFETTITTTTTAPYIAVRALDSAGHVLGTSPIVSSTG